MSGGAEPLERQVFLNNFSRALFLYSSLLRLSRQAQKERDVSDRGFPVQVGHDHRGKDKDPGTPADPGKRKGDPGEGEDREDPGPDNLPLDPVGGEFRDENCTPVPDIIPLEKRDEADHEDVELEDDGAERVVRVVAGKVGREGDEADKREGGYRCAQQQPVEADEVAELLVVEVPQDSKDRKRDKVVEEVRQDADDDLVDRRNIFRMLVLARDIDRNDQKGHRERVDTIDERRDPVFGDKTADDRFGFCHTHLPRDTVISCWTGLCLKAVKLSPGQNPVESPLRISVFFSLLSSAIYASYS